MSKRRQREAVASSVYTEDYFLSDACEGIDDFLEGDISAVKTKELALLDPAAGHRVLDLGCGRGEMIPALEARGCEAVGIDYASAAMAIARRRIGGRARLVQGDGTALPFRSASFDRVLLGDVIEHLPWDMGVSCLREVGRMLRPGGFGLVHTAPNRWFSEGLLPVARVVLKAAGRTATVEKIEGYEARRADVHPNELSPVGLRRLVRDAGLRGDVWVDRDVLRSGASDWTSELATSGVARAGAKVAGAYPLRLLLGNDLYARVTPTA